MSTGGNNSGRKAKKTYAVVWLEFYFLVALALSAG